MSPEEHYEEAERLLSTVIPSLEALNESAQRRAITTNDQMQTLTGIVSLTVAAANAHALLATGIKVIRNETRHVHYNTTERAS